MEWRSAGEVRWLEASLPGARAAFSTRSGGVSGGPYNSLNLGLHTEDEPELVIENRQRLVAALGLEARDVLIGHQVHGAALAAHGKGPDESTPHGNGSGEFTEPNNSLPKVDGHIAIEAGLAPLVFVADCLPVAMVGSGGVAMLHCGWRGLADGIVARGAEAIGATHAAIGPGIGPCCYEVGGEVLEAFDRLDGVAEGRMLNLVEVARKLLREADVEQLTSADLCTSCETGLFFSHRRDAGRTGRQAGLVWLESEG
jgi:purine-nucleoside/S-methyl-5'-thioadenosine phosphorylase / adenosine deaminase